MTPAKDIMLPTELERRQIFHWLKRISSYTAWHRMLGYYQHWTEVAEQSLRLANNKGWADKTGISKNRLLRVLKGGMHFEEGLRRLRQGDKRVFKHDANGEFVMATRAVDHWTTQLNRFAQGEAGINEEHTPLWDEFKTALLQFAYTCGECWPEIIESQWLGDPASTVYGDQLRELLPKLTFPNPLPEVPSPTDNLLIATGKEIPCSGIWQPIEAPAKKGFTLFRNEDTPKGPFTPIGCMNYLHEGSEAPQATFETIDDNPTADVTWRLIWRDDRYEDGTIPAEEADYVFLQPEASAPEPAKHEPAPSNTITANTGEPAPQAGRWLVVDDLNASVTLDTGERLPEHAGRKVRWVLAER